MKIKSGLEVSTDDFWYDLTSGGYLNPHEICENKDDADRVVAAIKVIEEFRASCEGQIEGFYR